MCGCPHPWQALALEEPRISHALSKSRVLSAEMSISSSSDRKCSFLPSEPGCHRGLRSGRVPRCRRAHAPQPRQCLSTHQQNTRNFTADTSRQEQEQSSCYTSALPMMGNHFCLAPRWPTSTAAPPKS